MRKIILTLFIFSAAIGILAPISFSLTAQQVAIQTNFAQAQTSRDTNSSDNGVNDVVETGTCMSFTKFDMGWCLAKLFYYIPFYIGGMILDMSATFMDNTASMTLSSALFQSEFIGTAWGILRDFSNMFFIFILLYIAIQIILGMESGGKKMVVSVIVIALVINFSMFITEAVIDFSNITALVFYNQLGAKTNAGASPGTEVTAKNMNTNLGGETPTGKQKNIAATDLVIPKSIGLSMASHFRPQIFTNKNFWDEAIGKDKTASPVLVIEIAMGVLYIAVGYSFFIAAISFIGRMVELWVLIIGSPFAFISYIVPSMKGVKNYGWTDWWKKLFEVSFAAPIYFFFLLIIGILMQSMFGKEPQINGKDWMITLLGQVILPALLVYSLIIKATDYVKKASGEIGEKMGNMAGQAFSAVGKGALSLTGGAAMGAGAWAGSRTFGKLGKTLGESNFVKNNMTKTGFNLGGATGWVARRAADASKKAQTASFDIRNSKLGGALQGATGMSFGSFGALSAARSAGGAQGRLAWKEGEGERFKEKYGKDEKLEADISHAKEHNGHEKAHEEEHLKDKQTKLSRAKDDSEEASKNLSNKEKELSEFRTQLAELKANKGTSAQIKAKEAEIDSAKNDINKNGGLKEIAQTKQEEKKKAQKEVDKQEDKIKNLTKGKYSTESDGKIKFKEPVTIDGKNYNAGDKISPADIKKLTAQGKKDLLAASGSEQLEKMSKTNENARMNEYMANKAFDRFAGKKKGDNLRQLVNKKDKDGKDIIVNGKVQKEVRVNVAVKRDVLGNITTVKIDNKAELNALTKATEVAKDLAAGAIVGAGMAGLGSAVHVASGAVGYAGNALAGSGVFTGKAATLALKTITGTAKVASAITSSPVINVAVKAGTAGLVGYNAIKSAGKKDTTTTSAAMKNMTGDHPHGKGVAVNHTKTQEISNNMWSAFGKITGEIFKSSPSHSGGGGHAPAAHPPKGGGDHGHPPAHH